MYNPNDSVISCWKIRCKCGKESGQLFQRNLWMVKGDFARPRQRGFQLANYVSATDKFMFCYGEFSLNHLMQSCWPLFYEHTYIALIYL